MSEPARQPIVPFTHRVFSALLLRPQLYAYAASEPTALSQGIAVVCFSSMLQPSVLTHELGAWGMLALLLFGLVRWLLYANLIVYPIARLVTWRPVPYRRLLACLGFAEAPAFLNAFAYMTDDALPFLARIGIWLWLLAANAVAVRSALAITWPRAAVIGIVSFIVYLAVGLIGDIVTTVPP